VAILLSRFPLITETFILREIIELERQGQPVRLVPLLREESDVVHPEARDWMERALFTPYLSRQIIAANAGAFRRAPGRYLGLLRRLIGGTVTSANFLLRSLALFPKAVYLAERLRRETGRDLEVRVYTSLSLNGHEPRPLIDPEVDLTSVRRSLLASDDWVLPFEKSD